MYMGALGSVFLAWLGFLVVIRSDMLYIHIESYTASTMACWVAALVNKFNKDVGFYCFVFVLKKSYGSR